MLGQSSFSPFTMVIGVVVICLMGLLAVTMTVRLLMMRHKLKKEQREREASEKDS